LGLLPIVSDAHDGMLTSCRFYEIARARHELTPHCRVEPREVKSIYVDNKNNVIGAFQIHNQICRMVELQEKSNTS
jgi:hypothetical protein